MASSDTVQFAKAVSRLCGWIYTLAWSYSFYPQPLLNFQRRSTTGSTIDFPALNVLGFVFYFLSNILLFCSPSIRSQYAARNPAEPEPSVRANDIAFAGHGVVLSALTLSMFWEGVWGFRQRVGQRVSRAVVGIGVGCVLGVGAVGLVVVAWGTGDGLGWAGIDVVYAMGYAKLVITVVKYIPQVLVNYKRKSTVGWSIGQILCDFTGGLLSLAQLVIDSSLQSDWSGVTGNPVKFWLGNVSIVFDVVFMVQHYVLYKKSVDDALGERRGLLVPEEDDT